MTGKMTIAESLLEQTEMSQVEADYVTEGLSELQEKISDWLETQVIVTLWKTEDDALEDPDDPLDQYVAIMEVNGRELVSFTDDGACDLVDTLSVWAIRHLIISCGNHNSKLELPDPAQA